MNAGSVQCNSNSCRCKKPGLCQLYCIGEDSCKGSDFNIYCQPNYPCEIYCTGSSACQEASVHGQQATDVSLVCSGTDSCKGSSGQFNCGVGECTINCVVKTACEDLKIATNSAKSFHCIGNCSNNAPNDYTAEPTYTPTKDPSASPSMAPSKFPTNHPTYNPSQYPTSMPSVTPSNAPSSITRMPTESPTIIPTVDPTHNPTLNPTHYPTVIPTYYPSYYPTIDPTYNPTHYPTVIPTHYPTTNPTSNPADSLSMITLDCEDNNIGEYEECSMQTIHQDENVYIQVSYWFSETIIYNLNHMECFLYNVCVEWFDSLKHVNEVLLCSISNVSGGVRGTNDSFCSFGPCLINIDEHKNMNNSDINATIRIVTTNTKTYNAVDNLKFRVLRTELQNIFTKTFDINVAISINLDYIGGKIKSQQKDTNIVTDTIILIVLPTIVLIVCLIGCVSIYCRYSSCILYRQISKRFENVKINRASVKIYRSRIVSESNVNAINVGPVVIERAKMSPAQNNNYQDEIESVDDHSSDKDISSDAMSKTTQDGETIQKNNKCDIDNALMHGIDLQHDQHGENDVFIHRRNSVSIQVEGISIAKNAK